MCNKLVSVIVPVFNRESYIATCINSILEQSYTPIEIIVVNDGSTDRTLEICESYNIRYSSIKLINKENQGPGLARRDGIKFASGEIISFVDSDDYIDNDMIATMVQNLTDDIDIVQCGYILVKTDKNNEVGFKYKYIQESKIIGSVDCAEYYAFQKNVTNYMCNKIFRSSLFKDLIYQDLSYSEDTCLLVQLFGKSRAVININKCLYYYVQHPSSLCNVKFDFKKLDNIKAGEFLYEYYSKNNIQLRGYAAYHICYYIVKFYCDFKKNNKHDSVDVLQDLVTKFKVYYKMINMDIVKNRGIYLYVLMCVFNIKPYIAFFMLNVYKIIKGEYFKR